MKEFLPVFSIIFTIIFINSSSARAQTVRIPLDSMLEIVSAEDELRFDDKLLQFFKSPDVAVRRRAALAAGRIGNAAAVAPLVELLEKDQNIKVRTTAIFALSEIENIAAANAVLKVLTAPDAPNELRARALEAAGKIAAANQLNEKKATDKTANETAATEIAVELGETILDVLEAEYLKPARDAHTVLLGLTAAVRAKPKESEFVIGKFLSDKNARIRADALNALVRLAAKNDDLKNQYRALLLADDNAIVRANAARAVGSSDDKDAIELLIAAASSDDDSRVRVAAIRALANLNDKRAAAPLLDRAEKLFAVYKTAKAGKIRNPTEKNELLETFAVLGKILQNSNDARAVKILKEFRILDRLESPETEIAFAKISPSGYLNAEPFSGTAIQVEKIFSQFKSSWRPASSLVQGLATFAELPADQKDLRQAALANLSIVVLSQESHSPQMAPAIPDYLRAYAAFKTGYLLPENAKLSDSEHLSEVLRGYVTFKEKKLPKPFRLILQNDEKRELGYNDVIVRATAAELLGEQPYDRKNLTALSDALRQAEQHDQLNDAALAILDALKKQQDKIEPNDFIAQEILSNSFQLAAQSPDYLVRRRAAAVLNTTDETEPSQDFIEFPAAPNVKSLNLSRSYRTNYVRALARADAAPKAVVTTEKGVFTINLLPAEAPLTVDNFVRLAQMNYFNNTEFHRVVPNFVVQGGDPRGDGNGSPGYAIRDEINFESYERGAVGMALSGKDTGGSQWFVTHSPQPHLDGGYTIFGRISEADMKIVDKIQRGDRILSIKIVQGNNTQPPRAAAKSKRKIIQINAANQSN